MKPQLPSLALLRQAHRDDIPLLEKLEQESFSGDLLKRRNFYYLLCKANALNLVIAQEQKILAYSILLFRRHSSLARLYSLAVSPLYRGQKLAQALLIECEEFCKAHALQGIRLEVSHDNSSAIALYRRNGYQQFGIYKSYYQDHTDALRMQKIF